MQSKYFKMRFITKSLGRLITITGGTFHNTEVTVDTAKLAQMTLFDRSNGYPAQLLLKFHSCCAALDQEKKTEVRIYHQESDELRALRHKIAQASQSSK